MKWKFWKKESKGEQTKPLGKIYRQGDVLLRKINIMPDNLKQKNKILAYGEVTGHKHRFSRNPQVLVFQDKNENQFVEVKSETAKLVHEEHAVIEIPQGDYEVVLQREFDPMFDEQNKNAIRRVMD